MKDDLNGFPCSDDDKEYSSARLMSTCSAPEAALDLKVWYFTGHEVWLLRSPMHLRSREFLRKPDTLKQSESNWYP